MGKIKLEPDDIIVAVDPGPRNMGMVLITPRQAVLGDLLHPYNGKGNAWKQSTESMAKGIVKCLDKNLQAYLPRVKLAVMEACIKKKKMFFFTGVLAGYFCAKGIPVKILAKRTYFPEGCTGTYSLNKQTVQEKYITPDLISVSPFLQQRPKACRAHDIADAAAMAKYAVENLITLAGAKSSSSPKKAAAQQQCLTFPIKTAPMPLCQPQEASPPQPLPGSLPT